MHHSLSILEVLSAILSACDDCVLCTLARTCRSFEGPALDLLWQHQTSFLTLVKAMPTDLWEERQIFEEFEYCTKVLYFRRGPTPTDFVVFNKYARRMTCVIVKASDGIVSLEATEILSQHMSSMPILPNLRKLSAQPFEAFDYDPSCPVLRLLTLLMGPKIEDLELSIWVDPEPLIPFIQSTKTLCPSLKILSLDCSDDERVLDLVISDLICHFDKLESLQVFGCLTTRALSHIATISTLRHLQLSRLTVEHIDPPSGPGLTHLSALVLESATDIMASNNFISLIGSIHLRELRLTVNQPSPSMQWQQCFQTLSCYYSSTLETLKVVQNDAGTVDYILGFAALEPLLTMRYLRVLFMYFGAFNLGDDELEQMALAWPHLQDLSIGAGSPRAASSMRVTLMGLVPLLKHCPDLRSLELPIDATIIDFRAVDKPGGVVSNHDITTMSVGYSAIKNPATVAVFLSYILPNIQTIHSWDFWLANSSYSSLWDEVPSLISLNTRLSGPPHREGSIQT